ncbi:MAG: 50S ribosomal protein L35 [Candidatus Margulisiibacteriota bacterium]
MKKLKTKKAAAKRIKVTGSGKLKRQRTGMRHLLEHQSSKLKRNKRGNLTVSASDEKSMKQLLPYA